MEGEQLGEVRCDGLVVATPAGSTGYNLANGGPVLAWGVEGYVVSFIAPHTLTARALVVAPGDVLSVTNRSREEDVEMTTDGRRVCVLPREQTISVRFQAGLRAAGAGARRELLPPPTREVRPSGLLRRRRTATRRGSGRLDGR